MFLPTKNWLVVEVSRHPFEKYESKWEASPIFGVKIKKMKPPPRKLYTPEINEPQDWKGGNLPVPSFLFKGKLAVNISWGGVSILSNFLLFSGFFEGVGPGSVV